MDDEELSYGCHPALMLFNSAEFYSYCDVYSSHPASRYAKKEKVRRCVDELRSVLSNTGVEVTGNTTLATLKATIDTLTKTRQDGEHRELREDGFRLSSVHQSLPFLDEKTYMLRMSLEEGEIMSVDRSLLELLNYPEHSWRTCQLANFLCMADIPCLLSCLMRIHKSSQRADATIPSINGRRQDVREEEELEEDEEEKAEVEEGEMKDTFQEHCMFRLRVGPSISKGAYGLGSRRKLMVPFVAEITLKKAKMTGQSVSGGTDSSAGTRIALIANSETTSVVGSSMRSSSATAQTHKSRDHIRMTLHKMNHAYPRHLDNDSNTMDEDTDQRTDKKKPVTFTSRIRRCSGRFVANSMEEGALRTQELLKEVAMVASLGYLPQDFYGGISIFDIVHPADLINLYEPLRKVISSSQASPSKLWISSPPVRWRCLNSSHTLIETRFCLSENSQTIHCRHVVVLEPECLDNFFDRTDVEQTPVFQHMKEADSAESAQLCRLQSEWSSRLRALISGSSEGALELEPDPPWTKAASSSRSHPVKEQAGGPPTESLSTTARIMPGQTTEGNNSLEGAEMTEMQPELSGRQTRTTDGSSRPQRLSLKRSRHQRKREKQFEDQSATHQEIRRKEKARRDSFDEADEEESKRGEEDDEFEGQLKGTEDMNELCYDSWSQLERVQGYLASVAGVESSSTPPSRLVPSADNSLVGMLPPSARDSSLTVSNVAHVDLQDHDIDGEAEGDQHMETGAMAVAMAAAVTAGVRMSPTWSADLGTASTASLTVENLARHTREQEMAYKRHLWRHLQREHERAVAGHPPKVAEPPIHPVSSRHVKRPRQMHSRPAYGVHDDYATSPNSIPISNASVVEPAQVNRPVLSNAPAPLYPYMWMIPVVPPVPPYLLYPPGHDNQNRGNPGGPPLLVASPYPPGWDVGVLSHELNSSDRDESGIGRHGAQMKTGLTPTINEEEDSEEQRMRAWGIANQNWLFRPIRNSLHGGPRQQIDEEVQPERRRSHKCRCQGYRRRSRNKGGTRGEKKPLNQSRRCSEHRLSGGLGPRRRSSSSRYRRVPSSQRSLYGRRDTGEERYGTSSREKRRLDDESDDDGDIIDSGVAERIDNRTSQMGNATVTSIAGSSFLYDDNYDSQSSSQQPIRRRPPPFWTRSNNARPVLSEDDMMRYQISVPKETRGISLLYKCQVSRLTQSELVVHQLFEMLNIDTTDEKSDTQQQLSEEVDGDEDFDDLTCEADDSLVDIDRIISQLLFEGDPSSDASSSDIVTSEDSGTSWNFRVPATKVNNGDSGEAANVNVDLDIEKSPTEHTCDTKQDEVKEESNCEQGGEDVEMEVPKSEEKTSEND